MLTLDNLSPQMKSLKSLNRNTVDLIRKYRKLDWFDFLDHIEKELEGEPVCKTYFDLMDEISVRKLESISEGGTYKLKAPSIDLLKRFELRVSKDPSFATEEEIKEFKALAKTTTGQ